MKVVRLGGGSGGSGGAFLALAWLCIFFCVGLRSVQSLNPDFGYCSAGATIAPRECVDVVGNRTFYVPAKSTSNTTKGDLILLAQQSAFGLSLMSRECRREALIIICNTAFKPCTTHPFAAALPNFFVVPLPSFPCYHNCTRFNQACATEISEGRLQKLDCKGENNGQPLYPKSKSVFTIGNRDVEVKCTQTKDVSISNPEECPIPMQLNKHIDSLPVCSMPCPLPFYTEGEQNAIVIVAIVLNFISIFFATIQIVAFVLLKDMRKFPANVVFVVVGWNLIRSIVSVVLLFIDGKDIICENEFVGADRSDNICLVSGLNMIFITMIDAGGITCVIFFIMLVVVFRVNVSIVQKCAIPTHLLLIGISLASVGVLLGLNDVVHGDLLITSCIPNAFNAASFWPAFMGIIIFELVIAMGSTFITAFKLASIENQRRRGLLTHNLSLILLVVVFSFVILVAILFLSVNYSQKDAYRDSLISWVQCSVRTRYSSPSQYHQCQADTVPNFGFAVFYQVIVSSAGTLMFFPFLANKRFCKALKGSIRWQSWTSGDEITTAKTSKISGVSTGKTSNNAHSHSHNSHSHS